MSRGTPSGRDEIIGKAFTSSLLVFLGLGIVIAMGIWLSRDSTIVSEGVSSEPSLPPSGPALEDRVERLSLPFKDVREDWNIQFTHESGANGEKRLPETLGGGVAITDVDGDQRPDVIFINGGETAAANLEPHRMVSIHRNLASSDGSPQFEIQEDVPLIPGYGMGIAAGDVDGDGDTDFYITTVGRDRLLINESVPGRISLRDASDEWDLPQEEDWETAAGFIDVDADGDLDLVSLSYVEWTPEIDREVDYRLDGVGRAYGPPTGYAAMEPSLLINDQGVFKDEGLARGFRQINSSTGAAVGKGLGLAFHDLDQDGDLDILGANDTTANGVWLNDGFGNFTENGIVLGLAFDRNGMATGAMGLDVAHYRGDETFGVAVGNFANEPTSFFVQRPGFPGFVDDGVLEGVAIDTRRSLTFGVLFADLDLDGYEELIHANGHLEEDIAVVQPSQRYQQAGQVFRNITGRGAAPSFAEIPGSNLGDLATPIVGRGLASGDIDLDGDIDLIFTQVNGPPLVLRNDLESDARSITVYVNGIAPNTEAIGAELILTCGERTQRRMVMPTKSYLSQVDLPVIFGIGSESHADRLEIIWPDGSSRSIQGPILPGTHVLSQ